MIDSGLFSSHQFGISRTRKVMSMQVKFYDDVEDALLRFAVIKSGTPTKYPAAIGKTGSPSLKPQSVNCTRRQEL